MSKKPIYVTFCDKKLEADFNKLRSGKTEDEELYDSINQAIMEIKKDPCCALKIQKRLWPKEYIRKHKITNLWKFDLPKGWRLVYTIKADEVLILNVILEWFDHKGYERRFKY